MESNMASGISKLERERIKKRFKFGGWVFPELGLRGGGPGTRPRKAFISKSTEPKLKNEYVLESTCTGGST